MNAGNSVDHLFRMGYKDSPHKSKSKEEGKV